MPSLSFDKVNRSITVLAPDTEVSIQELLNAIRDFEDELINLEVAKIADASGKEDLGGGLSVGITLKLFNWKLKFEDRPGPAWVDCQVSGGNLVAVNGAGQPVNPIEPASYVTVTVVKAVSAALTAAIAEWTEAEKDSIFADTGVLKSDTGTLKADTETIKTEIDKVQHYGGLYEPDKESLEAIRAKLDEMAEQIGVPTKRAAFKV